MNVDSTYFEPERPKRQGRGMGGLIIGGFIVLVGVLFLLRNLGVIYVDSFTRFWPVILILIGISHFVSAQHSSRRMFGVFMCALGTVFLLMNMGMRPRNVWNYFGPMILIAVGVHMIWRRRQFQQRMEGFQGEMDQVRQGARDMGAGTASTGSTALAPDASSVRLNVWSMFSGVDRRVATPDFMGGEINVTFGGAKLDLRNAHVKRDSILECNAIFGGIQLLLPTDMPVLVEARGIFGGVDDKGLHPVPGPGPKLIITGTAIFGGIDIKN